MGELCIDKNVQSRRLEADPIKVLLNGSSMLKEIMDKAVI